MSTVLAKPLPFTVVASSSASTAPASNLNRDEPGLVWRSNGLSGAYVTVQLDGSAWDTIGLVMSNLRSTDTIQVRAGSSQAAVNGTSGLTVNVSFPAWSGTAPLAGAMSLKLLDTPVTSPFVRIDVTSTGNPAGYVQASRLVLGKRVTVDCVSNGAELNINDTSDIVEGSGYEAITRYAVKTSWKVTLEGMTDNVFWQSCYPFLKDVGMSKAILFVPDDTQPHVQVQNVFGRITSQAKGTSPVADYNTVELVITSLS